MTVAADHAFDRVPKIHVAEYRVTASINTGLWLTARTIAARCAAQFFERNFEREFRADFARNIPCQRDFHDYTSRSPGQGESKCLLLFDNRVCDVVLWLSLIRYSRG